MHNNAWNFNNAIHFTAYLVFLQVLFLHGCNSGCDLQILGHRSASSRSVNARFSLIVGENTPESRGEKVKFLLLMQLTKKNYKLLLKSTKNFIV